MFCIHQEDGYFVSYQEGSGYGFSDGFSSVQRKDILSLAYFAYYRWIRTLSVLNIVLIRCFR